MQVFFNLTNVALFLLNVSNRVTHESPKNPVLLMSKTKVKNKQKITGLLELFVLHLLC
jgi:hypothetical protein